MAMKSFGKCSLRINTQAAFQTELRLTAIIVSVRVTYMLLVLKVLRGHGEQLRFSIEFFSFFFFTYSLLTLLTAPLSVSTYHNSSPISSPSPLSR